MEFLKNCKFSFKRQIKKKKRIGYVCFLTYIFFINMKFKTALYFLKGKIRVKIRVSFNSTSNKINNKKY